MYDFLEYGPIGTIIWSKHLLCILLQLLYHSPLLEVHDAFKHL